MNGDMLVMEMTNGILVVMMRMVMVGMMITIEYCNEIVTVNTGDFTRSYHHYIAGSITLT